MSVALDLNNPHSACEIKKVAGVEFRLFSPEHIVRMSACEIVAQELYENGYPKEGGLHDPRMGTTDYKISCAYCGMDCKLCPGHFGHIKLTKPVYHVGYLQVVLSVLRCVCYGCSRILIDMTEPRAKLTMRIKDPKARFAKIAALCQGKKRCEAAPVMMNDLTANELPTSLIQGGCGCLQPKYTKDGISITMNLAANQLDDEDAGEKFDEMPMRVHGVDSKRALQAEEALEILQRISPSDLKLLGFNPEANHPAWMILTVLPVPPPAVRPYVQYGSDRSEDDLTLKLLDIFKTNQQLAKQEAAGGAGHVIQEITALLQFHVATFMNNDLPGIPVATTRSRKPIKSLRQRLKGKEGRLRGNLMGKRVDFSARTVITGDPNLAIDQVGVPKSVAMNLTFPETVTAMNIEEMRALVANGPFEWPGARYIIREEGKLRFDLRHPQGNAAALQLNIGDRVERHMINNDYVLFNRQPSLHRMSIMGHRVKILPWSTFRLNLSVTSPYNADFDGDEMNLHLAQSHETQAEIKHLMIVSKQIVSPQSNKPVMGIVQDSLLGIAKFTKRDVFLTRAEIMNLLIWIPHWDGKIPTPAILKPEPLWTGKQVITRLLMFDSSEGSNQVRINLVRDGTIRNKSDNEWNSDNDARVIIRNNEHLAGIICRRTAGSSSGSLIHVLWLEAGPERAKEFLSVCQLVIGVWLLHHGFTVGCRDIIAPEAASQKVAETLDKSAMAVTELISLAQKGQLETQPGKSLLQSFEARVNQELNQARESSGRIAAESLDERNNIIAMVNAGSKGSTINISQIMACVGQQNVEGKRIPFGFRDRSLPHFLKHDYGPQSRGFVFNSYLTGLIPQEIFFHAMGGREGIIDTACKTSETGYIQRRLIKAMEDVLVAYDHTVRTSGGEIIQFLYGEDGLAGEYIEDQVLTLLRTDHEKMEQLYRHDFANYDYGKGWITNPAICNTIRLSFEQQSILENEWSKLVAAKRQLCEEFFPDGEARQHIPVNVTRLLEFAQNTFVNEVRSLLPKTSCDSPMFEQSLDEVSPVDIALQLESLLESLTIVSLVGQTDYIAREVQKNATGIFQIHLRTALNSRQLMKQHRLGPKALQWLFGEIQRQFFRALAHPGEVVGAMAAQSIGEPATQMTLNTFHFAGVGSKNVTLGVPRLKELINVTKTVRTPSLTIYLKPHIAKDQDAAKSVQSHIEHTTLEKMTSYAQIFYDPNPMETIVAADKHWVAEYYEFPDDDESPHKLGPWVLRIQLIEKLVTDKALVMKEIVEKITSELQSVDIDCIWTDDNSEELVIRIRLKSQTDNKTGMVSGEEDDSAAEEEHRYLRRLLMQCLTSVTLRGIQGISKVYMREEKSQKYDPVTGSFHPTVQWVLDTDGCNLATVLRVSEVDATKTVSNSVTEILEVLGIEAARRSLLRELRAVISFDGSYVNHRHLAVLCDVMTHRGYLMSITRTGINRIDKGCLSKCSFEETVETLIKAAAFNEKDFLKGVTENVMFGQLAAFGTGAFDVVVNEDKLGEANPNFLESAMYYSKDNDMVGSEFVSPTCLSPTSNPLSASNALQPVQNFIASPFSPFSPMSPLVQSPTNDVLNITSQFSPVQQTPISPTSPMSIYSPHAFSPVSPDAQHPTFSPTSPTSYLMSPQYSPTSPLYSSAMSPAHQISSPVGFMVGGQHRKPYEQDRFDYSPMSPSYSPTSPLLSSPKSPTYAGPTSLISPTSPSMSKLMTSPMSPRSIFSPLSPGKIQSPGAYSIESPNYSPTSPTYSPANYTSETLMAPDMVMTSPRFDAHTIMQYTSPAYSPTSPMYSPTSPTANYSPFAQTASFAVPSPSGEFAPQAAGLQYSPTSPAAYYSPTSPLVQAEYAGAPDVAQGTADGRVNEPEIDASVAEESE